MIHHSETGWTEPSVTINGQELTLPEAMALRVAVSSFRLQLTDPTMRVSLGPRLAEGYNRLLQRIEQAMLTPETPQT